MESCECEHWDDITMKARCTEINEISINKFCHEYDLYVPVHLSFALFFNHTVHICSWFLYEMHSYVTSVRFSMMLHNRIVDNNIFAYHEHIYMLLYSCLSICFTMALFTNISDSLMAGSHRCLPVYFLIKTRISRFIYNKRFLAL